MPPAEHRHATILFAEITGFRALAEARSPDEAYAVVTGCLRLLDDVARRHGGAVDKYLGDALMVLFGFPVSSDDHALAAAAAALAMREAVAYTRKEMHLDGDLDVRIGINTGWIVAGDVGSSVVREFAVLGDCVNVAARLKERAKGGEIYLGPDTAEATLGRFDLRPLPALRLKGKQRQLQPHALQGPRGGSRAPAPARLFPPFIGRVAERERLMRALEHVIRRRGGVVIVSGPEGSGKSRLLAEAAAAHPGPRWLHAAGERFRSGERLALFRELQAGDPGRAAEVLAARADREPLVLVAEDLQWADPESVSALLKLVSHCAARALLLVATGRAEAAPALDALRARARETCPDALCEIALERLSAEEVEGLIDAVAESPLDPATRRLVTARGAGLPGRLIPSVYLAPALRADAARAEDGRERGGETERRRATVLFADLVGFTTMTERMDPVRAHALVTSCLAVLDDTSKSHGGSVEKHLGDCILATFGVPVAIEDAPRAAVNAAIEMRRRVEVWNREQGTAVPLEVHTGIETGIGIAGDVSGPLIREYALMGESVSSAARLSDASPPGAIWVGEGTFRATRDDFDYAPVVAADGTRAFEVRSREVRLHRERAARRRVASELVGREAERAVLRDALSELAAGRGGSLCVIGEAGLGKTRLVEEIASEAGERLRWLVGRSLSIGHSLSFHPFADLLGGLLGIDDRLDETARLAGLSSALAEHLGAEAEEQLPFLAVLLGLAPPEGERERIARLPGDALGRLVLRSATALLRRLAAEGPLVLELEDLHWADLSSIELLQSLLHLAEDEPILFLLVHRPHFALTSERVRAAAAERLADRHREVTLAPLPTDAARLMLRNLFRGADVPFEVRSAIETRALGNPFYVEEVVRALLDGGALVERGGLLEATPRIREVEIPGTLQEVIMARVDRLPRAAREVLRVASAIGGGFDADVLAEVAGKDDLRERLDVLLGAEMVVPRTGATGEYRFAHPLIQEVVYDSIVRARREELHRAIARAIEARVSDRAPGHHAVLAWHWGQGNDPERAEEHLFQAGDEAARAAASDEALRFFQEASKLYLARHGERAVPARRATLERNIGLALNNRGRHIEAIAHFDEALRLLGVPVTDRSLVLGARLARDLAVVLARLYLDAGRRRRRPATDVERTISELVYDRGRAQTTALPARYLFDWFDGLRRLTAVDPRTLPHAGGQYASTIAIFSYGGVSFGVSERFLRWARRIVDPEDATERMIFAAMDCIHHVLAGDWSDAHEVDDDFVEDRIRNGQVYDVTNYLGFSTEKRIRQGRFEEAMAGLSRVEAIAEGFQYELALSTWHGLTAFLLLEQERHEDAVRAADLYYSEHRDPLPNLLALSTKARAQLAAGERDGAARSLAAAEQIIGSATGVVPPYQKSAWLNARLAFEVDGLARGVGDARRARRAARAALRTADKVACRRAEALRLDATRCALAGDRGGAARRFERALETARALGMAPELRRIEVARSRVND